MLFHTPLAAAAWPFLLRWKQSGAKNDISGSLSAWKELDFVIWFTVINRLDKTKTFPFSKQNLFETGSNGRYGYWSCLAIVQPFYVQEFHQTENIVFSQCISNKLHIRTEECTCLVPQEQYSSHESNTILWGIWRKLKVRVMDSFLYGAFKNRKWKKTSHRPNRNIWIWYDVSCIITIVDMVK